MFKILITFLVFFTSTTFASSNCSLKNSMIPYCYHERVSPVFKVALLYYGDARDLDMQDLKRISKILVDRFSLATNKSLSLEILDHQVLPYKYKMPSNFEYNNIMDPRRLQRIWYYENVGVKILKEVYEGYKQVTSPKLLDELDAIITITGAQFDGLGFASGRVSVTEFPREIAWGLPNGGRVEYPTDYQIVDELIHELGHNLFLGHTSTQCQKPELSLTEREQCCNSSPSKNDVLSYCRLRSSVDETFMHGFESCNLTMLKNLIIPSLLRGGAWNVSGRQSCL